MNEKMKKYLATLVYKTAFATALFLILFLAGLIVPSLSEKLSPIWTKNTDFQKLGELFFNIYKELFPF